MDYKYIEQLLERYWECRTTVQEEHILKSFFRQADIPDHLKVYSEIFRIQDETMGEKTGTDFDRNVLNRINGKCRSQRVTARPHPIGFRRRLRPLYQAAGLVALILTIGTATQKSFDNDDEWKATPYAQEHADEDSATVVPGQQSAALEPQPSDTLNYTR